MKFSIRWLATSNLIGTLLISHHALGQATNQSNMSINAGSEIQEIVVTAERRAEPIQKVPVSVVAVTADAAEAFGISDSQSLVALVPGLDMTQQGIGLTPFLRGVGSDNGGLGAEPSVPIYIDGVYMPSPFQGEFDFNNIDRIEVLKGPQGTLFGRNSTGGIIQVVTKDPSLTSKQFDGEVTYANYNDPSAKIHLSIPLSDTLAIDVAAIGNDQLNGWGNNLHTNQPTYEQDNVGVRSKLLWAPDDATNVRFSVDYSELRSGDGGTGTYLPGSISSLPGGGFKGFYNTNANFNGVGLIRQAGSSLNIQHDFDWASLVSISSYRQLHLNYSFDEDETPVDNFSAIVAGKEATWTQELQIKSLASSKIQWDAGFFYYNDKSLYSPVQLYGDSYEPLSDVYLYGTQNTESYALYGQATVPVVDDFTHLTLGIRETFDYADVVGSTTGAIGSTPITISPQARQSDNWHIPTWRLSVDRQFTPDIMGYISYNRGSRTGLFNLESTGAPAVQPEKLDAYEVGVKTEWLNHRLRANLSAFDYDFKDIQVAYYPLGLVTTLNAAAARIYGMDLDVSLIPVKNLTINGGLSYLHGRYNDFPDAPGDRPNPVPPACVIGVAGCGGNTGYSLDATGFDTIHTPTWTYNVGATYVLDAWSASLLYSHNSGFYWTPDNRIGQPAYGLLNASLQYAWSKKYYLRLWGKNLTGSEYYETELFDGYGDKGSPAPPRTFGITFGVHL